MSLLDAPDRQSQFIRLILVILGMCLAVVGWLRWIRGFLLLPVLFATPMAVSIQPPAADANVATPAPAFAVAVVTAHKSDGTSRQGTQLEPGGRFKATSVTLKDLIQSAYRRHAFDRRDIAGGPAWIDTDRFDIVATAPEEHSLRRDGFPARTWLMLRSLLADRFRLQAAH
jgi:Protein of unknown function (DUF3738)